MPTTTARILQSTGLSAGVGAIASRELGITSDTERPVIGSTVAGSKWIGTESEISITVVSPAPLTMLKRANTKIIIDTTLAGADVTLDIQNGAQVIGYKAEIYVIGIPGRKATIIYGSGQMTDANAGCSAVFVWDGSVWLLGDDSVLQNQIDVIDGEITTIQGDVTTLQGDVTTLQGDVSTLQSDVLALQALNPVLTVISQGASNTYTLPSISVGEIGHVRRAHTNTDGTPSSSVIVMPAGGTYRASSMGTTASGVVVNAQSASIAGGATLSTYSLPASGTINRDIIYQRLT
jgi:hypothetical protein